MSDEQDISLDEAEKQLEEAVMNALRAGGYTEGVLVDWVLVTAQSTFDDQGRSGTSTSWFVRKGQPMYRTMGLLDYLISKFRYHNNRRREG